MEDNKINSRRKFIKTTGAIAGITVIPSKSVWGACNASGVSGGSQALEEVCGTNELNNLSNNSGGFSPESFNALLFSVNGNNQLPSGSARKMAGKMFKKGSWLDEKNLADSFTPPVFRCGSNFKTLIWQNGEIKDHKLKLAIRAKDSSVINNAKGVDSGVLKSVLNPVYDWHMNELLAVIYKLKAIANVDLTYISGVQSNGKAYTAKFNVLDTLKRLPAEPAKTNIAALYLNLAAGFAGGVPVGFDAKSYCEHLVSILLENATYDGFANEFMQGVEGTFTSESISAYSLLS